MMGRKAIFQQLIGCKFIAYTARDMVINTPATYSMTSAYSQKPEFIASLQRSGGEPLYIRISGRYFIVGEWDDFLFDYNVETIDGLQGCSKLVHCIPSTIEKIEVYGKRYEDSLPDVFNGIDIIHHVVVFYLTNVLLILEMGPEPITFDMHSFHKGSDTAGLWLKDIQEDFILAEAYG